MLRAPRLDLRSPRKIVWKYCSHLQRQRGGLARERPSGATLNGPALATPLLAYLVRRIDARHGGDGFILTAAALASPGGDEAPQRCARRGDAAVVFDQPRRASCPVLVSVWRSRPRMGLATWSHPKRAVSRSLFRVVLLAAWVVCRQATSFVNGVATLRA